ncbi:hypothetical protein SORBI_3001G201601 [Sorghum bicolor]|uniref:Uncharacterized protein n=1 Tax=Sorghum bicolor TaxID=4558 RepID=A0A1Z5S6J9_SORBI|nr:hypothetical protein SORBI_3001G201601 [Sorghum bicolor]
MVHAQYPGPPLAPLPSRVRVQHSTRSSRRHPGRSPSPTDTAGPHAEAPHATVFSCCPTEQLKLRPLPLSSHAKRPTHTLREPLPPPPPPPPSVSVSTGRCRARLPGRPRSGGLPRQIPSRESRGNPVAWGRREDGQRQRVRHQVDQLLHHGQSILALLVVGFGFWMSTHNDECRRSLTVPVIALGGVIFLISLVGFLGAWKNYLIMLFVVLVAIMVFTVLAFIITNSGSGHTVPGARYKEYRLQDYSSWCGYPALNASYFDLSFHPVSTNVDCKLYKNTRSVRCYDCNSCNSEASKPFRDANVAILSSRAGVAQYMKTEWRVVAIFNVILFVILSFVYFVGCCARRNTGGSDAKGRGR